MFVGGLRWRLTDWPLQVIFASFLLFADAFYVLRSYVSAHTTDIAFHVVRPLRIRLAISHGPVPVGPRPRAGERASGASTVSTLDVAHDEGTADLIGDNPNTTTGSEGAPSSFGSSQSSECLHKAACAYACICIKFITHADLVVP